MLIAIRAKLLLDSSSVTPRLPRSCDSPFKKAHFSEAPVA
jgi:hypothetical protein